MRVEMSCSDVREELSARLDDEGNETLAGSVDDHLVTCAACRAHEERLWRVRRAVRARPAESVPDLSGRILAQISEERRSLPRARRRERVRYAVVGAAASIAVLLAASLPWSSRPPDSASAAAVVSGIRSAARSLDSYQATFAVEETGWLGSVPQRSFEIAIAYVAPERVAMRIEDATRYPSPAWPRNDVALISDGTSLSITEPATCPRDALPDCSPQRIERRVIQDRQPFDGIHRVPTDAILPLVTLASSEGLEVKGSRSVLDRRAHVVVLRYGQALPLVESFQVGGAWRDFHPSDEVEVWLDQETWFPLGMQVRATGSNERAEWAARNGYQERRGTRLLRITATSLSEEPAHPTSFVVEEKGSLRNGGFRERALGDVDPSLLPTDVRGLEPYRAGRVGARTLVAWTRGMNYLKLVEQQMSGARDGLTAEEVRLEGGPAYYSPASERDPRRVIIFTENREMRLESNLPRADLLAIASSIDVRTRPVASGKPKGKTGISARRVAPGDLSGLDLAPSPTYMPEGYEARVGLLLEGPSERETLSVYYRRAEAEIGGFGIRITRSVPAERLDPSSKDLMGTIIARDVQGRWSIERSELEWIHDGVYNAVAVPGFDRATALRIARSL